MKVRTVDGADAAAVRDALPAALDGEQPLALGFAPAADQTVPAGTAAVIATSGSSGIPKRVILSGDALRASAAATAARIGSGQWMLALPSGYVAGLQVLVRAHLAGTDPILLEGRFTADAFVSATTRAAAGRDLYTSLVPAQLTTLIDAAEDPSVLRALRAHTAILVGGQALSDGIRTRAADLRVPIVRTYGSSETSGGCVYDGIPLDGVAVQQVDGELWLSGPMLATGYLGDPERTAQTFPTDTDGTRWYRTGDLGEFRDGVVEVHGRRDNVIVSGGINISLDRVERIVRRVPGLEHAVVLGMPHERWGEASVLFADVRGQDGGRMLEAARALVAAEIGRHARPVQLEAGVIPLLASGKPDRQLLRRMIHEVPPHD
ncbi:AMP-binding protein [Microbacterium sp. USHLN186]|uniref:AMP-binding protein n=1 Tax=Microbacterium sp. USHLN186 TaxID=3081286 RepID=UPI003019FFCC